ncbi:hypothetical protein L6452_25950 [Arctium lappa]|uniref:Uncharacterized protein n=1 Tax=Arctium lappa TaxID=4217 RepID=A0ACB9ABX5_ARCLA|nr:hypothetical protein L6452_44742 [Arctium lappa]KAI3707435.1 hypothetical protein L6452_25950 [Arctium lappa]
MTMDTDGFTKVERKKKWKPKVVQTTIGLESMDAGSSGKAMAEVVSGETMQQHVQDAVTQMVEEAVSMPKNVTDQVDSGLVGDSERTVMEPIGGGTVDKGKNIEGEEAIDYASVAGPKLSTSERDQGPKVAVIPPPYQIKAITWYP